MTKRRDVQMKNCVVHCAHATMTSDVERARRVPVHIERDKFSRGLCVYVYGCGEIVNESQSHHYLHRVNS
jgi:hypothetical protein